MNFNKHGLILLHKPEGITSFHALDEIKKRLQIKKVGHTGTLDKFANGLLLVLTGKYTRLTPFFSHLDKEYISQIKFGEQTNTLDPEGKIILKSDVPGSISVDKVLKQFEGETEQIPPRFSAIHLDGERLYKKALRGEEIRLPKRKVTIHTLEKISYNSPLLTLHVHCSGGTYIRALARDIGQAAGSCAYVTCLTRTKVGNFNLSHAVLPSAFLPEKHILSPSEFLPNINGIKLINAHSEYVSKILHGTPVQDTFFIKKLTEDGNYFVFSQHSLIAIINKKSDKYRYITVFGGI